jgi:phosphate transport system substrate-binding protein
MKNRIGLITIFTLTGWLAFAQQKDVAVVKLRGTRLTYPLVNKWIEEFSKEYSDIKVSIAPLAPADSIDFTIASYALTSKELEGNREGVVVTRYVQLPVANSHRPGLAELQVKGITEKNLSDLFFTSDTPSFIVSAQPETPIALYVRDRPVCAVKAFATHFGNDPKELKGTGIKGDDQDLAEAVRKDVNGLSFNNLGFIYDIRTRKITEGLAVIPMDLNENGKIDKSEQIYKTLDDVINFIEKTHHRKFVNERVNFVFNKSSKNSSAGIFLNWVLTKGQKFNHELGFLNQDDKFLAEQRTLAAVTFSSASCNGASDLMSKRKSKQVNE